MVPQEGEELKSILPAFIEVFPFFPSQSSFLNINLVPEFQYDTSNIKCKTLHEQLLPVLTTLMALDKIKMAKVGTFLAIFLLTFVISSFIM